MFTRLPEELILSVFNLLTKERDKFAFAFVNKVHWRICSTPDNSSLCKIEGRMTALQLRKYSKFLLQNRYYDQNYLKHVFQYAINLDTLVLANRKKYPLRYALFIFKCINTGKNITLLVPPRFRELFEIVLEDAEQLDYITLKVIEDENLLETRYIRIDSRSWRLRERYLKRHGSL